MNNVIIHSHTREEHMGHLREIFQKLRKANLTIKAEKCEFSCKTCQYLGYVVGNGQIKAMEFKIWTLYEFQKSITKKDV